MFELALIIGRSQLVIALNDHATGTLGHAILCITQELDALTGLAHDQPISPPRGESVMAHAIPSPRL